MHGKTSMVYHDGEGVFAGLPNPFEATRYHSLVIRRETIPDCLQITAETDMREIMGIRHKDYPIEGVQFHPESILTQGGKRLLANFVEQ
jgi:anthranilate synthase/aminodeoxychorismate synthase-like glutamine amidotransferase